MGTKQTDFLVEFKGAFAAHFGESVTWSGGQAHENTASLRTHTSGRRSVGVQRAERFELGDITSRFRGWKLIVEFESGALPLSNLLKYWPYLRGELSTVPECPVLICHFSDWWSYATRRDLWEWTLGRMQADRERLFDIQGQQFDHGGEDRALRIRSIQAAVQWIDAIRHSNSTPHTA